MSSGVSISSSSTYPYTLLLDESGAITYVGKAPPNSSQSSPVWQIRKLETNGTVFSVSYADGNDKFDNVWDNRASLSYS